MRVFRLFQLSKRRVEKKKRNPRSTTFFPVGDSRLYWLSKNCILSTFTYSSRTSSTPFIIPNGIFLIMNANSLSSKFLIQFDTNIRIASCVSTELLLMGADFFFQTGRMRALETMSEFPASSVHFTGWSGTAINRANI